jgi:hypothetical protein
MSLNGFLSRRRLLAAPAALSSASATGKNSPITSEARGEGKNITTEFVRLCGRTDGVSAYWVMRGVRYLWTGSREPAPLYNVDMLTVMNFKRQDNGDYLVGILENSYSTDIQTGKIIDSFINPLTGKEESFWVGSPYPPLYTVLTADGQKMHKNSVGDKSIDYDRGHGALRFQRGFPGEIVVEDRDNATFKSTDGSPHYADLSITYRAQSPRLITGGAGYENVTKTHIITRHWPHGGGETVHAPQLMGIYYGRKYYTAEEAYAVPGVKDVEVMGPGTLKQIAEF